VNSHLVNLIRSYAGWAALVTLAIAVFIGLVANSFALPVFLLIAACALAIFRYWDELRTFDFWAFDEWIRTRRDSIGIRDWYAPHQAAEMFCNPAVVKARNEASAEMNTVMMEMIRDPSHAPSTFSRVNPFTDPAGSEGSPARRHTLYDAAQARYNQCNAALSSELLTRLTRGDLLAKGLLMRDDVALAERIIPTSRWRVLSLDIAHGSASGHGWSYTGVVIGKRLVSPKAVKPPSARS